VPYGQGKLLDIYRPVPAGAGPAPTVLLWHGVGPDERDVLETLAVQAAGYGLTVVVPRICRVSGCSRVIRSILSAWVAG
jgi:predicted esterase